MANILNLIAQDDDGQESLKAWLENNRFTGEMVSIADINKEMDAVKPDMRLPTKQITADGLLGFDFGRQIGEVLKTKAPTLHRVLMAAAQTDRAAVENAVKKSPDFVSHCNLKNIIAD